MICPHCQTINPGAARFCLNCGQSLPLQCSNCEMELPVGARFCMYCGQPVIVRTQADDARLSRLVAVAPDPLAKKMLAASHLLGERRLVTTLFVDVVGSTSLAEQLNVESWAAIMNGLFDRLAPIVYRFEGTIARLLGDSLMAFYGAPIAHEDDPLRAVRTALAIIAEGYSYAQEVHQAYNVAFAIRVCINTGQVIIGAIQDDLKYEYTAMGGAVNLVSRMKFAAQPMTILVSEYTYPFIAPVFECTDLGPVAIKDFSEPIRIYQVHGPKDSPGQLRGLAGLQSPMIGRDAELTMLTQLCHTVRAGLGRGALIVGEPGLGKTRLIAEWQAAVDDEQARLGKEPPLWVQGHCLSFGQRFAYHLLIDILRSILRIPEAANEARTREALLALTEELFPESAFEVYPYLGHLLSLNLPDEALRRLQLGDPQALRTQYLNAFRQLLIALATSRPLVLVLEDLHWADPSSTGLLIDLLPLVSATPILFCMVTRPEREAEGWKLVTAARDKLGGSLTELTLRTLSEPDSQKLVANLLKIEALPNQTRQTILKKTEGNPFFVEEVIRMLIDQGVIIRSNGDWIAGGAITGVTIPDNLQGILLARIDRLPNDVKHTIRVAAVIGRQFPKKVLAHVLGENGNARNYSPLPDRLNTLESTGLIRLAQLEPDLEYLFRHALVQDAAYASLLAADQKQLHLAVGMAVEQLFPDKLEEQATILAGHFERAGEDQKAYKYFILAGEVALASYANQEAESHFRSALGLARTEAEQAALSANLGETLFRQSRFLDALQIWRQGINLYQSLADTNGTAQLYARSARAAWHHGDVPQSLQLSQEGLAAVDSVPESPEVARLMHEGARAYLFNGQPEQALPLCRQALAMAERLGVVDVQADALATFGVLPDLPPAEVLAALTKAVALTEKYSLLPIAVRAHHNMGVMISGLKGDLQTARYHYLRASEIGHQRGVVAEELFSMVNAVEISLVIGNIAEVEEMLGRLERLLAEIADPAHFKLAVNTIKARLMWIRGEFEEGLRLGRSCQLEARRSGDLQRLSNIDNELASGLLDMYRWGMIDDLEEVETIMVELIEIGERGLGGRVWPYCRMSSLQARQGKCQEAHRWLNEAHEAARAQPSIWNEISLNQAEAELANAEKRWPDALAAVEEIAAKFANMGTRWLLAQTLRDWAEIHIARGEPADLPRAQALFREARAMYEAMDAPRHTELVEERVQAIRAILYAQAAAHHENAQELAKAAKIQASFLPDEVPDIPGWQLVASLTPARQTSGDFYDFIPLPGGKLGLVIADVADKGAAAALYMTSGRTLIHTFALEYPDAPALVIAEANRRITLDTHEGLFITVFYGVLDPVRGQLVYCNAGHNPPFVLHAEGDSEMDNLSRTGIPMGIIPDATWKQEIIQLFPGDILVFYTDGLTEAQNQEELFYGEERLQAAAQSRAGGTAQEVHDAIHLDIGAFTREAPQFDDLTLIILVRDPS